MVPRQFVAELTDPLRQCSIIVLLFNDSFQKYSGRIWKEADLLAKPITIS